MLHIAQAHHLVGQQLQRPALSPTRSLATGQMNQLGFSLAIQTALFGTFPWKAEGSSHFQVLLHKALFDAKACRKSGNLRNRTHLPQPRQVIL